MFRSVILALIVGAASAFVPIQQQQHGVNPTALRMAEDAKKPFFPTPDQGTRTTMNPYYQIDKYSTYPPGMQETRFGSGLPPKAPAAASLPAAGGAMELASAKKSDDGKKVASVPDQGASTTMPRMPLHNGGNYPPGMKW